MSVTAHRSNASAPIRVDLGVIFISMELSQSKWLITSLSPGSGEKRSQFTLTNGGVPGLLVRFAELQRKARARSAALSPHRHPGGGLDGFWVHRVLEVEGIESHVVDPASIAVSRRKRRVKTDRIDGETLFRTLLAYKRGEPRVCAMVKARTPEEEDRRRVSRERKALMNECVRHTNRIKGLLFGQGISGSHIAETGVHDWRNSQLAMGALFDVRHRTSVYMNNKLEQDHRGIKGRVYPATRRRRRFLHHARIAIGIMQTG